MPSTRAQLPQLFALAGQLACFLLEGTRTKVRADIVFSKENHLTLRRIRSELGATRFRNDLTRGDRDFLSDLQQTTNRIITTLLGQRP